MHYLRWILIGIAVFLILDSCLALVFGKRYMLWGLNYTPASYRLLIERISELTTVKLFGIKLAEGFIGLVILYLLRG